MNNKQYLINFFKFAKGLKNSPFRLIYAEKENLKKCTYIRRFCVSESMDKLAESYLRDWEKIYEQVWLSFTNPEFLTSIIEAAYSHDKSGDSK